MAQVMLKSFDPDAILRDIQADVEQELKKNPEKGLIHTKEK